MRNCARGSSWLSENFLNQWLGLGLEVWWISLLTTVPAELQGPRIWADAFANVETSSCTGCECSARLCVGSVRSLFWRLCNVYRLTQTLGPGPDLQVPFLLSSQAEGDAQPWKPQAA